MLTLLVHVVLLIIIIIFIVDLIPTTRQHRTTSTSITTTLYPIELHTPNRLITILINNSWFEFVFLFLLINNILMIWMELDFINILVFFVFLSLPVWIAFSMIYVFWVFIIFNNTKFKHFHHIILVEVPWSYQKRYCCWRWCCG